MMWFDAHAKLAEIAAAPPATSATSATQFPERRAVSQLSQLSQLSQAPSAGINPPRVAIVADVATPSTLKPENQNLGKDRLEADAAAYLDFLRLHGPHTYGAVASELGWGVTRTWQAEAKLRATGRLRYRLEDGKGEAHEPE